MIHVVAKPEPAGFDAEVRKKGLAFLAKEGIALDQPIPPKTKINHYWLACLDDLYSCYDGYCAYLAVFFERVVGAGSVDHFAAKSRRANLIYEWSNYRLAYSRMNSRKWVYDDVLDPFEVETGWFHLEMVSGRIYPNPNLPDDKKSAVQGTINRLDLDDDGNREMRARHYQEFTQGFYTADFLQKRSPLVWYEAQRQGLL